MINEQEHKAPLVSIGMLIYNEANHLRQTLESLLRQTFTDFELIICDNVSTDESGKIAREFAEKDSRIKYFLNDKNIGSIANSELALKKSCGKYFLLAAGHDLWNPSFLEKCIAPMEQNDSVVLSYSLCQSVDEEGNFLEPYPLQIDTCDLPPEKRMLKMLQQGDCYYIYGLYRRDVLAKIIPYRRSFGPDILILLELSLLGEFAYVPEPLFHMRKTFDTAHLKSHLGKFNFCVGPLQSPKICIHFFGNIFDIIRKRCNSRRKRLYLYPRAAWVTWKRWHRLLIAILIAGLSPNLLDYIQRKRGKAAAIDENH